MHTHTLHPPVVFCLIFNNTDWIAAFCLLSCIVRGWAVFKENANHAATTEANYHPLQNPHCTQTHKPSVTPTYIQEALHAWAVPLQSVGQLVWAKDCRIRQPKCVSSLCSLLPAWRKTKISQWGHCKTLWWPVTLETPIYIREPFILNILFPMLAVFKTLISTLVTYTYSFLSLSHIRLDTVRATITSFSHTQKT